jgi:predicted lipoprotein with Yx(FWY)xxD motif
VIVVGAIAALHSSAHTARISPGEGGLHMMQRLFVPLLAVAIGLMVAVPAMAQGEPLVKVATDPTLGKILVDSKGMTLYLYSRDEKGVSNCYNQCETNWPILRPAAGEPLGSPDINGKLGVINRTDGTKQVTYNDIPLYYFARDAAAGETKGQAVGGIWWILAPGANQITPAVAQASPAASPAPAAAPAAPAPAAKPAAAPAAAAPAAPAQAPKPAAAASPAALPRTGSVPFDPMGISVTVGAAGMAMTVVGAALLRRRGRRQD